MFCLARLGLTRHVSPAWQGDAFPLKQGYLLEGVSLTDDTLILSSSQMGKYSFYVGY